MLERNLKEQIVTLLQEYHLLSAGDILKKLALQGKGFNKTSIYRALEQLVAENIVCRHYFSENEAVFELSGHEHIHLFCTNCGTIASSENDFPELKNIQGFHAEHVHVTLFGKCASCEELK